VGGDSLNLKEGEEMRRKAILCMLALALLVMPVGGQETALAWNEMGNFLYDRGMYPEAFRAYEEAVELDPSLFLIYELKVLEQGMYLVESGSMYPNLRPLDVVTIEDISTTKVITWEEGEKIGYTSFNNSGDVICYRPYGKEQLSVIDVADHLVFGLPYPPDKATPVIHRAMRWVDEGEPMWEGGPAAPFAGYITKGDNNSEIDQNAGQLLGVVKESYFNEQMAKGMIEEVGNGTYLYHEFGYTFIRRGDETYVIFGINYLTLVREDWVIGVVRSIFVTGEYSDDAQAYDEDYSPLEWLELTVYGAGDGLISYIVLYSSDNAMTTSDGSLTIEIYDSDEDLLWSRNYSVQKEDFVETTIGLGAFERSATILSIGRLSYDDISPGLESESLEIRVFFRTPDGQVLKDKTTHYVR
jgi:signal peptidase